SLLAPSAVAIFVEAGFSWSTIIVATAPLFLISLIWVAFSIQKRDVAPVPEKPFTRLSSSQILILATFAIYVAAEVMTSMWLVTYLVEYRRLSVVSASKYLSLFFIFMAVTRGLCFLSLPANLEKGILWGCLSLSGVFFTLGHLGHLW